MNTVPVREAADAFKRALANAPWASERYAAMLQKLQQTIELERAGIELGESMVRRGHTIPDDAIRFIRPDARQHLTDV